MRHDVPLAAPSPFSPSPVGFMKVERRGAGWGDPCLVRLWLVPSTVLRPSPGPSLVTSMSSSPGNSQSRCGAHSPGMQNTGAVLGSRGAEAKPVKQSLCWASQDVEAGEDVHPSPTPPHPLHYRLRDLRGGHDQSKSHSWGGAALRTLHTGRERRH